MKRFKFIITMYIVALLLAAFADTLIIVKLIEVSTNVPLGLIISLFAIAAVLFIINTLLIMRIYKLNYCSESRDEYGDEYGEEGYDEGENCCEEEDYDEEDEYDEEDKINE